MKDVGGLAIDAFVILFIGAIFSTVVGIPVLIILSLIKWLAT